MITLYWYPGCSTCRKAARWLDEQGIAHERVHLVENTPAAGTLRELWVRSGAPLKKLFNTSGQSYRTGRFSERLGAMSDEDALAALAADGMLIRRPILTSGEGAALGFDAEAWAAIIGGSRA